jgi:hypothetical protein
MKNTLTDDEIRLREALINQQRGMQNCAPGSPLYDKLMGTNLYAEREIFTETPTLLPKLILQCTFKILLTVLALGIVLAVFG